MILIPRPGYIRQLLRAKIKTRKPALTLAEINPVLAHYDLAEWQVCTVLSGRNSYNLLLQTNQGKKVLKKYYWSLPSTLQEHSILNYLSRTDFPSPKLLVNKAGLTYTEIEDKHYAIYDFVDGYCYTHYFVPAKTKQHLVAQAGEMLAHFHRLLAGFVPEGQKYNGFRPDGQRLWRDTAWYLNVLEEFIKNSTKKKRLDELDTFLLNIADELKNDLVEVGRHFDRVDPQLPKVVIHGDYSPKNILYNNQKLAAVLDLGDACIHLRVVDFARGLTAFAETREHGINQDLARTFLEAYETQLPLFDKEVEIFQDIIRWQHLKNIVGELGKSRPDLARNKWQKACWLKTHGNELQAYLLPVKRNQVSFD